MTDFDIDRWVRLAEQAGEYAGRVALGFADTVRPDGTSAPGNFRLTKVSGLTPHQMLDGLHELRQARLLAVAAPAVPGQHGKVYQLINRPGASRNRGLHDQQYSAK